MSTHNCPGHGCSREIANRYLMCGKHWAQVPADVQAEVYRTNARRNTSEGMREYRAAVKAAIAATVPPAPKQLPLF